MAATLFSTDDAAATVTQLDGTSLPQPTPAAELSVVTSRGFLASDDTLAGLFKLRGETLDPIKDAHQTPGTFSPQCGFTGKIVLHGGDCQNALGWYNVMPGSTTPPSAAQIYTLVPADLSQAPPNGISCNPPTEGFCPMAEPSTTQPTQHTWVDYTWNASAIASDPRYKGGQVGFALVANPNGRCTQTKYSQAELNAMSTQYSMPWVTTLIYQSTADPSSYYLAFEDLPMPADSWNNHGNGCDGDFNDFVFYVTGLNCEGGGVDCDTMMPGVCAGGTTQCSSGGTLVTCQPNIQPSLEKCNGLDDDCDGVVDNPDAPGLCAQAGFVCNQGTCVPPCSDDEFPCSPPLVCDKSDQLCKDPACIGKVCGDGQTCYKGTCIGGCDGVVCPPGEVCRIGQCVDPCQGVTCPDMQVCDNGACVSPCSCRPCAAGQTCTSNGTCVDTGCDKVTCTAPQVCVKGQCQDGCLGVVCPTGQLCMNGQCATPADGPVVPPPDAGTSIGAGGIVGSGGTPGSGTGGRTGTGGIIGGQGGSSGGLAGSPGTTGTGGASGLHAGGLQSCSCDESAGPRAGGLALLLTGLAIGLSRRTARATRRRR